MSSQHREKKPDEPIKSGAEALFLELMMQMLAFFILLTTMSVIVDEKRLVALGSLAGTFSLLPVGADLGKGKGPALPAREIVPGRNAPARSAKELTSVAKSLGLENALFILPLDQQTVLVRLPEQILFAPGRVTLLPKLNPFLDQFAKFLRKPEIIQITIEGHADTTPLHSSTYPSNWELSATRAMSVFHALFSRGVAGSRMVVAGMGDQHPLKISTANTENSNRRVDLMIKFRPVTADNYREDKATGNSAPKRVPDASAGSS